MSIEPQARPRAWFHEPMVWFVLALPASVVVAGITTVLIAWRGADGAVADDTYRLGLAINEELARTARARELGVEAEIAGGPGGVAGDGDAVRVRVSARAALPDESVLELRWVHPGRRGGDREARLVRTQVDPDARTAEYAGRVFAKGPAAENTAWRLVLAGRFWRLDGDTAASRKSNTDPPGPAAILLRTPE